jgi:uridine kinase
MERIIKETSRILQAKSPVVIGIDGPCASGKTTLAKKLSDAMGAQVIHTDDFFLPFEMKTPERMAQTGGNVHYERFYKEIKMGIDSGKPFEYGVYSCASGRITETKTVIPQGVIIIEGSYSMHPEMQIPYDLRIFVEASYEIRLQRIRERNGEAALEIFKTKWIPLENRYFEFFGIKDKCDIKVG